MLAESVVISCKGSRARALCTLGSYPLTDTVPACPFRLSSPTCVLITVPCCRR